jgi:hypothetical protein
MPTRAPTEEDSETADVVPQPLADPVTESFQSLALARSLGVAARLGIFSELSRDPVELTELAQRLQLRTGPLRLMLEVLMAARLVDCCPEGYTIAPTARRWLDPDSPTAVTTFMSHSLELWDVWKDLPAVLTGELPASVAPQPDPSADLDWQRRGRAGFEFSRCIGDELADAIDLPQFARSILDLGGGHGGYAAVLCRRNPMLRATVVDQAPAVEVGRELIWEAGLERHVTHQAGDIHVADLGGPHDAVICGPLLLDATNEQSLLLLSRVRTVLQPGGLVVTLGPSRGAKRVDPSRASSLELFARIRSGVAPMTADDYTRQLAAAGFGSPRARELTCVPELSVLVARAV